MTESLAASLTGPSLIGYYPLIRHAHMTLAGISVALFSLRVGGVLAGAAWPMSRLLRVASVVIDTLLISAGATLWWLLSLHPLSDRWLFVKLVLVVVYIVLGSLAMKRARTRGGKAAAFVASLAVIALVVAIAIRHDAGFLWRALGLAAAT
ncbi:MAG: SirB2 family protein [Rubrivivax sp.]|nr:SirB2 family protein [Rubrivivax sp.]